MKLSIVVICWNDWKVIRDCLESIYAGLPTIDFEVIVSDNGSSDGSPALIRKHFPQVRLLENGANLGFAKGNNRGIQAARGEYTLILNPDTIVHGDALDRFAAFADQHSEAGAFGCRVLNPDGSFQNCARPFPTVARDWIAALYLRQLASISDVFLSDTYTGWNGDAEKVIDWQSGCCVMFRTALLKLLGGFDEQFFYHFEEVDLCRRVWDAGYPILYTPEPTITHLGGQSVNRFPVRFELEKCRNRYRYYYKHFGRRGSQRCRRALLARMRVRQLGYGLLGLLRSSEANRKRLDMYRTVIAWNRRVDPIRFVECGEEPRSGDPALVSAS